jgi:hypothetical protein
MFTVLLGLEVKYGAHGYHQFRILVGVVEADEAGIGFGSGLFGFMMGGDAVCEREHQVRIDQDEE